MLITQISATTLPDAWFQCLYDILDTGRAFTIDRGSNAGQQRLEFDFVAIQIQRPWERCTDGLPLIPEMPEGCGVPAPVAKDYIREYAPYLMTAEKKPNEQYTYGQRLRAATIYQHHESQESKWITPYIVDQIERIIETYIKYGHRNNQMVLQVAQPADIELTDPPCLRQIDTRIQDDKLHFFPYFRSWDLWGGLPANLAGISVLQEYMASSIGVEQGEMVCASKGLHLYDYAVNFAALRCLKDTAITQSFEHVYEGETAK
jgi:thymidylate synthase